MDNESKRSETHDALVACPGFRWMPGMANTPEQGSERVVLTGKGLRLAVAYEGSDGMSHDQIADVDRPDLDDPATCGCFEDDLLPAAWGPDVTIANTDGPRVRSTTISDGSGRVLFHVSGKPKGERLAAALMAAPRSEGA